MLERKWLQRKARDPLATCVGRGHEGKAGQLVYGSGGVEREGRTWGNATFCLATVLEAGRCVRRWQCGESERDFITDAANSRSQQTQPTDANRRSQQTQPTDANRRSQQPTDAANSQQTQPTANRRSQSLPGHKCLSIGPMQLNLSSACFITALSSYGSS
jgi:hypothetical protein